MSFAVLVIFISFYFNFVFINCTQYAINKGRRAFASEFLGNLNCFVYHDRIWYPSHGKKVVNQWLTESPWGKLFEGYRPGGGCRRRGEGALARPLVPWSELGRSGPTRDGRPSQPTRGRFGARVVDLAHRGSFGRTSLSGRAPAHRGVQSGRCIGRAGRRRAADGDFAEQAETLDRALAETGGR